MANYGWHYLERGKVLHARRPSAHGHARTAVCGTGPAWFAPGDGWYGSREPAERLRASVMPKCRRCVKLTSA